MKWINRKTSTDAADAVTGDEPVESKEKPEAALQAQWTRGSQLGTKAFKVFAWACVASGLVSLWMVTTSSSAAPPSQAPTAQMQDVAESAQAGEFATNFVVSWLRAIRGQEGAVAAWLGTTTPPPDFNLPEAAPTVSEPAVASVAAGSQPNTYSVVTAVTVAAANLAPTRRYFAVAVVKSGSAMVAAAFPSPVPAPVVGPALRSGYGSTLTSVSPAWAAVDGYLGAALAGRSDVSRYISPGSLLTPIVPTPYASVALARLQAERDILEGGSDTGTQLRVMATAAATATGGWKSTVQLALLLTVRDGRWEVTSADPIPLMAMPSATPSTSPPSASLSAPPTPTPTA